jgi:predicted RND superfamily exporter protein
MRVNRACALQLMPFIILGVGVDDVFVIIRSMEEVTERNRDAPIPERFREALSLGGMSITVTSVTNFAAFMFGSITSIPAIRWCALTCWFHAITSVFPSFCFLALLMEQCFPHHMTRARHIDPENALSQPSRDVSYHAYGNQACVPCTC